jgi:hypothetical protein
MSEPFKETRTGARPRIVDGVTFCCWRVGILRCVWRSEDGRLSCAQDYGRASYRAAVAGVGIDKRFRSLEAAMRGAIKPPKVKPPEALVVRTRGAGSNFEAMIYRRDPVGRGERFVEYVSGDFMTRPAAAKAGRERVRELLAAEAGQ